jgi:hypothetical protein
MFEGGAFPQGRVACFGYQSWPTRGEIRLLLPRGGALLHYADLVRFRSFASKEI